MNEFDERAHEIHSHETFFGLKDSLAYFLADFLLASALKMMRTVI